MAFVTEKISRLNISQFTIKAVEEQGTLIGFIRFSAKQSKGPSIIGITRNFCFDVEKEILTLDNDAYFFGTFVDLSKNYNGIPFSVQEILSYFDREYSKTSVPVRVHLGDKYYNNLSGFLAIPYSELRLTERRKLIFQQAKSLTNEILLKSLYCLEKITDPTYKSLKISPSWFCDLVLGKSELFVKATRKRITTSEELEIPRIRIISTPMGGMPQWIKDHLRSRQAFS